MNFPYQESTFSILLWVKRLSSGGAPLRNAPKLSVNISAVQRTQVECRIRIARCVCLQVERDRLGEVLLDALAPLVQLAQVERRVGVPCCVRLLVQLSRPSEILIHLCVV